MFVLHSSSFCLALEGEEFAECLAWAMMEEREEVEACDRDREHGKRYEGVTRCGRGARLYSTINPDMLLIPNYLNLML